MERRASITPSMMARSAAGAIFGICLSSAVGAFELLSEGAMDSVSAVSVEAAEDILNIAGSPAAGLADDYETLPFQTSISVEEGDTDEVQEELDFALTQEVEAWAEEMRQQSQTPFEVGFVDELPGEVVDVNPFLFQDEQTLEFSTDDAGEDDRKTIFQQGRIRQQFELLESGVDSISYRFERYVERAATINANPNNDRSSIGSGYISESRSTSQVTLTAIRDGDKPLF